MGIKVLSNNILVKRNKTEKVTESGIVLATNVEEAQDQGIVVSKGPGEKTMTASGSYHSNPIRGIEVGDTVMFNRSSGTLAKLNGELYVIINESQVLAVITQEE